MIKSFAFSFISLLFCCALTLAQYPKDEPINPYPKPVKERVLVQRFDCNTATVPQWKALNQSVISATDHAIRVESSGHDPYILLPLIKSPVPGTFEFRIGMKNTMAPAAEVFWGTTQRPGSHPDFSVRFGFLPDGQSHAYAAVFTTEEPLSELRFDPGTSTGICDIEWVELYKLAFDETEHNPLPTWFDPDWAENVASWKTFSSGQLKLAFDEKGSGARIFAGNALIGEIYPLAYLNPELVLGGVPEIPLYKEGSADINGGDSELLIAKMGQGFAFQLSSSTNPGLSGSLRFTLDGDKIQFALKSNMPVFGPVFRPQGTMQQAVLCGVEYLEEGEHSSSTADIETPEHLRFAPKALDVTWPFMAVVTDKAGFGLLWDNPNMQAVFATPDFLLGDPQGHYMGLHGSEISGMVHILTTGEERSVPGFSALDELMLHAVKQFGIPKLPPRPRDDTAQRQLNLAAFVQSLAAVPGAGWRHAAIPGVAQQTFGPSFGCDFVSVIWQLSGKLVEVPRLDMGGGHLRNPAAFFLMGQAGQFLDSTRNESKRIRDQQRADGAFPYGGKYLKGHWSDTASGHCGNALYALTYNHRITGDPETLAVVEKGLEFANRYTVPRGAQVWELSLHTPDIMGSSRMCMANVWAYEATGHAKYLDAARRWAMTGLPFVYLWERTPGDIQKYATTPVFGATDWVAPNWIGLPVQWCGLDYAEALFLLAGHDPTLDWKTIAEGILITAERMQYPDGPCVGLLPDSFTLSTQHRNPADIIPTVIAMQRRRLQGEPSGVDVVVSPNGKYRVVSPFKTSIETNADGKTEAVIEAKAEITYQILVNGEIKTIESQGRDRIELTLMRN